MTVDGQAMNWGVGMSNRVAWILACVLLGAMLVLAAGCSSDSGEESETAPAATEDAAEEAEAEETESDETSDEPATGMAAFAGTWENAQGSVFRLITFREDGTADTVNYSDVEAPATWTLEDGYLEVETDGGESWGSDTMWLSDTEWDWAYEDGTWIAVE
jgi:hypothetical protein